IPGAGRPFAHAGQADRQGHRGYEPTGRNLPAAGPYRRQEHASWPAVVSGADRRRAG
ncbi:hypothetical protein Tco_0589763, partial [Tanacetum coccineum]